MAIQFRSVAVTVVAVAALGASATPAAAGTYVESPPSFDGLTMLRVAYGYNVTKAYDLSFPARSDEACEIAGVGMLTFVTLDHTKWANGPGNDPLQAAYDEAAAATTDDPRLLPCFLLSSESMETIFPGLPRVWPSTLKQNFNRLRKALRKGDCEAATKRLNAYPRIGLPGKQIRRVVKVSAGGSCKRR